MIDKDTCGSMLVILAAFYLTIVSALELDAACPERLNQIFLNAAPKGNAKAGKIIEVPVITTLQPCVDKCCSSLIECNVAFVYNKTCFHVTCISNELCLPLKRNNITANLAMQLVKPVADDDSWIVSLQKAKLNDLLLQKPYEYESNYNPYGEDEILLNRRLKDMYNNFGNYPGEIQYGDVDMIPEENRLMEKSHAVHPCRMMDSICPKNEICFPLREEPGQGFCDCKNGYERLQSNRCVKQKPILHGAMAESLVMKNNFGGSIHGEEESEEELPNNKKRQLTISAASKTLKLPETEVTLSVFVIPDEKTSGDKYTYLWTLISQPNKYSNGTMTDQTKDRVKLSNLSEGIYQFKITVTGSSYYGEAFTNVSVLPPNRINKPPQVFITPSFQTVKLPNNKAILDGSSSTDDDKIESWNWEIMSAPLGYQTTIQDTSMFHTSMLQLDNLQLPGNYTFKLTVTDTDKKTNSTTATIEVLKEIDYPPNANAGTDVIIYHPQTNVTLNGSLSTDDHEIMAWEWIKDTSNDQSKPVDMQNTRTPYLQLSNLEVGVYTFVLKVMDIKNQSSTSKVRVFVKPASTNEPNAVVGNNQSLILPQTWGILNGTESTDDVKIVKFEWRQISGPNEANIVNANMAVANATQLKVGNYSFQLTVYDTSNNNASAVTNITVKQEQNAPPVANGGGDLAVTLPVTVVVLNGSRSYDDLEITNWTWTREGASLAMGTIIGNTSHEPVLMLTNVVAGRYVFKLTVNDGQGLSSSDTVSVFVNPDPLAMNLVELTLTMEAISLTQAELDSLTQKLMLLMGDDVHLFIRDLKVDQKTGQLIVIFYVSKGKDDKLLVMSGLEVERVLKDKFFRDFGILGSSVAGIRTSICQNNCSGHGVCNSQTRACMCETFWMPDVFYFWGVSEPNCDWSILYVIIGVIITFVFFSGVCFGITCMCRRTVKKPRSRQKPQKYSLLGTQEEDLPTYGRTPSTISDDSDTDSDVLFETKSRNGILKTNGDAHKSNGKYSMTRLGRRIKT